MSADSKGAIVTHVHELIKAANGFKRYLDVSNLRPENQRHGGFEIEGGQFARDLAAALQRLRDSALPVQVRVGFKALDRLFQGWIERWGWERVIGQDGEAFLAEKQELWAKNEVSWYAAVLSHVEAYSAGEISERPYFGYFESARVAEQKGIAPASPRVTDPRILDAMHNGWVHKPYLATDFPKLKQGEYLSFRDGIQDLQEGIRGYSADAFADQQPTAPRQEPFVVRAPMACCLVTANSMPQARSTSTPWPSMPLPRRVRSIPCPTPRV